MQLNKADVERITEELISKLSLEMSEFGWVDNPSNRTIILRLGDREITRVDFTIDKKDNNE